MLLDTGLCAPSEMQLRAEKRLSFPVVREGHGFARLAELWFGAVDLNKTRRGFIFPCREDNRQLAWMIN